MIAELALPATRLVVIVLVTPAGAAVTARVTVPVKPPARVRVIASVAFSPCAAVTVGCAMVSVTERATGLVELSSLHADSARMAPGEQDRGAGGTTTTAGAARSTGSFHGG